MSQQTKAAGTYPAAFFFRAIRNAWLPTVAAESMTSTASLSVHRDASGKASGIAPAAIASLTKAGSDLDPVFFITLAR